MGTALAVIAAIVCIVVLTLMVLWSAAPFMAGVTCDSDDDDDGRDDDADDLDDDDTHGHDDRDDDTDTTDMIDGIKVRLDTLESSMENLESLSIRRTIERFEASIGVCTTNISQVCERYDAITDVHTTKLDNLDATLSHIRTAISDRIAPKVNEAHTAAQRAEGTATTAERNAALALEVATTCIAKVAEVVSIMGDVADALAANRRDAAKAGRHLAGRATHDAVRFDEQSTALRSIYAQIAAETESQVARHPEASGLKP